MDKFIQNRLQSFVAIGGISRAQHFALVAFIFCVTSTFGFLQPFSPLYLESAGLDRGQIGVIVGVGTGFALVLQPLWGWLSDRIDQRRPFMVFAALCAGVAYLNFPHAHTAWHFLLLSTLGANGSLYLNAVGGVLVGRLAMAGKGGAAYAGFRVWGSVGYVVVTLITGLALNPQGQKLDRAVLDHVFQTGPLLFFVIAIISLVVPDAKRLDASAPRTALPRLSPNLRWFLAAYFLYIFALYGASNFLALYMKERGGTSLWITSMFAGGVVCEILVMRLSGRFSDQFGRRPLLAVAFVLLPIRLALYGLMTQPFGVFAVQLLHGLNFGIMGALAIALINDLSEDEHRGKAQARLATVAGLATSLAPLLFGWVAQSYSLAFMFEVASGVAAVAMVVFVLRVEESHPEAGAIAERVTPRWKRFAEILDAPPGRN